MAYLTFDELDDIAKQQVNQRKKESLKSDSYKRLLEYESLVGGAKGAAYGNLIGRLFPFKSTFFPTMLGLAAGSQITESMKPDFLEHQGIETNSTGNKILVVDTEKLNKDIEDLSFHNPDSLRSSILPGAAIGGSLSLIKNRNDVKELIKGWRGLRHLSKLTPESAAQAARAEQAGILLKKINMRNMAKLISRVPKSALIGAVGAPILKSIYDRYREENS